MPTINHAHLLKKIDDIYAADPSQKRAVLEKMSRSDARESDILRLINVITENCHKATQPIAIEKLLLLMEHGFTIDFLEANITLWKEAESLPLFYTLAKQLGASSDGENILLQQLTTYAASHNLDTGTICRLLQCHLLWLPLPVDSVQPDPIRSALLLFQPDPISLAPILRSPDGSEGHIDLTALHNKYSLAGFHEAGIRIDSNGMVFFSKETIAKLNTRGKPNSHATVKPLSKENLDITLIQKYDLLWEMLSDRKQALLNKPMETIIAALKAKHILPDYLADMSCEEILEIYVHQKETTNKTIASLNLDPRISSDPSLEYLSTITIDAATKSLLNKMAETPKALPILVHLLVSGFSAKQIILFKKALEEKCHVKWTDGYCLDFLMQIPAETLTETAIAFLTSFNTSNHSPRSIALALQNRFQFIIWFGVPKNDTSTLLNDVTRAFFEKAHDPYLRPAMIQWLNTTGADLFPGMLSLNQIVTSFCKQSFHCATDTLLPVLRQTATLLSSDTWHTVLQFFKLNTSPAAQKEILLICKTTLLQGNNIFLSTWLHQNETAPLTHLFIDELFEHNLLTAAEISAVFHTTPKTMHPKLFDYYERFSDRFAIAASEQLPLAADTIPSVNYSTLFSHRATFLTTTKNDLDTYRSSELVETTTAAGETHYHAKALFPLGGKAAWFTLPGTKKIVYAFSQYYTALRNNDLLTLYTLLNDTLFRTQTGFGKRDSFWSRYCQPLCDLLEREKVIATQVTGNAVVLTDFLFSQRNHGHLDPLLLTFIWNNISEPLKALVIDTVIFVRGFYGFSGFIASDGTRLTQENIMSAHHTSEYFSELAPQQLLLATSAYEQPSDAQTAESKPLDQCTMTADELYQYEEADMLAGEQILAMMFQHRIINFPQNLRQEALIDDGVNTLFYFMRPIETFMLSDPLYISEQDRPRYKNFQNTLRSLTESYDLAHPRQYQSPIVFIGAINTGNHYIAYFIGKSNNGKIHVITIDPSPQTALIGTVEFKEGKGACPTGDKEALKRTLRRFFHSTLPGCHYEDLYVTQMLRERDCGPLSLFTLKEIMTSNAITLTDDAMHFDARVLSIQAAPNYSDSLQYFYPSHLEENSRRARAYWAETFKAHPQYDGIYSLQPDQGADPEHPKVYDRFTSEFVMPNSETYEIRAKTQFDADQSRQYQSELLVYLNLETTAFTSVREALTRTQQLPDNQRIIVLLRDLNDEIPQRHPTLREAWELLYRSYLTFDNMPLSTTQENALSTIRTIVIYNLNNEIQIQLLMNFKNNLKKYIHQISHENLLEFIHHFLAKAENRTLYQCCTESVKNKLTEDCHHHGLEHIKQKYYQTILSFCSDQTIFNILSRATNVSKTEERSIPIWQALLAQISDRHSELSIALLFAEKDAPLKQACLSEITQKISVFYQKILQETREALSAAFLIQTEAPAQLLAIQHYDAYRLIFLLLPPESHAFSLSQEIQDSCLFLDIIPALIDEIQKITPEWLALSLTRKVEGFLNEPETRAYFDAATLNILNQLIEGHLSQLRLSSHFYQKFNLIDRITQSTQAHLTVALFNAFGNTIENHPLFLRRILEKKAQLFLQLAQRLNAAVDQLPVNDVLLDSEEAISNNHLLELLLSKLNDDAMTSLFIHEGHRTFLGMLFVQFLKENRNTVLSALEAINKRFHKIVEKLTIIVDSLQNTANTLTEGGYKGRRDTITSILSQHIDLFQRLKITHDAQKDLLCLAYFRENKNILSTIVKNIQVLATMLLPLLRYGNCDPSSTTQPLRILLCHLLALPENLQDYILTEPRAKLLDDAAKEKTQHLLALPVEMSIESIASNTCHIVLVTPADGQNLPEPYECDSLLEIIARCVAWWRLSHHAISTLQAGSFLNRAQAPGGFSPFIAALTQCTNDTHPDRLFDALTHFLSRYPRTTDTSNSAKVIVCLRKEIANFELSVSMTLQFTAENVLRYEALKELITEETKTPQLRKLIQKYSGHPEATLSHADICKLIGHFYTRWFELKKKSPDAYLNTEDTLSAVTAANIAIAARIATAISYSNGQYFKHHAALLMPGSAYDRCMQSRYRHYHPTERLLKTLLIDDEEASDYKIDAIQDIRPDALAIIAGIPLSLDWYRIAAGFKSLTFHEPDKLHPTLHNPITGTAFSEKNTLAFKDFGEKGIKVYFLTQEPPTPTERSLRALLPLLHTMILHGGGGFCYSRAEEDAIATALTTLHNTLKTYGALETQAFWNTPIPGQVSHATIQTTLQQSIRNRDESGGSCTHGTGRIISLVIHQYFRNADSLLPHDAKKQRMQNAFENELRYIDANPKTPLNHEIFLNAAIAAREFELSNDEDAVARATASPC